MSRKIKKENLNNVSNSSLNTIKIVEDKIKNINNKNNEYEEFCNKYINIDFTKDKIEDLKQIYDIGNELLNQYFITNDNICENTILIQLQYILSKIMYNINIKQVCDLDEKNQALNEKLTKAIKTAKELENEARRKEIEIRHVKNDIKSIMTTIISIILAISIIPTAIAGIEKIAPNYILPFLSSIILFGIIMITFVYSIYQDELKKSTWKILILSIIICFLFWCSSLVQINISKNEVNEVKLETSQ